MIGNPESGGSAAESVTGTRTEESAEGPDPANAVGVLDPGSERERDRLEEQRRSAAAVVVVVVAGVESGRRTVGRSRQQEETAGVGRGVENEREGAGAGIARETGREARGSMGRRSARETGPLKVVSGCWRKMKEKWVRAWRSVGTETGTADAATGTERGAGETGTETGNIRGSGGRGTGGTAERSVTAPYEMTQAPKMTWPMRMREERRHTWRSTVRMG